MNYEKTLEFLYAQLPVFESVGAHAYKPGLERVREMDELMGYPHRSFKSVHVAGTNGKGTTCHTLASVLQCAGHKVGLFTSPHLVDFDERIRVDGAPVSHEYVVAWVSEWYERIRHLQPSFFELATMMAFCWFRDQGCDWAVIEVGLGGRLDCTNIIMPELSIITNVSFDHMQFLGDTLPQIAGEKAGIMKRGVPCVVGEVYGYDNPLHPERQCDEDAVRKAYVVAAQRAGASLFFACDNPQVLWVTHEGEQMVYRTAMEGEINSPLTGDCQPRNANTVLTALHLLNIATEEQIRQGFAEVVTRTHLMGRWQTLQTSPRIIADTGHNEGCFTFLGPQLQAFIDRGQKLRIVFGMVADKDISTVLSYLPAGADYFWCNAPTPRALPAGKLSRMASEKGLHGDVFTSVAEAYSTARSLTGPDDILFIGGSNFIVSGILKTFF